MALTVRLKSTGQLGTIPDDKFDPNLFEKVNLNAPSSQPTTPTQPSQTPAGDAAGNLLMNILRGVAQPVINTGKRVAGAGYEINRATNMVGGDVAQNIGLKELANKLYQNASNDNPYLKTEQDINAAKDPLQIAKDSAGVLAFGIPNPVLAGAASGFSGSGGSVGSMIGNTALGAAGGYVGSKVLNKLLGIGKGAAQTGNALRKGVVNPTVRPDPFMAEEENLITSTLQKYGLKGSAEAQKQQMPKVFRSITQEIQTALGGSKKTVDVSSLADDITGALDNNINFDPSIEAYNTAKNKFFNQIVGQANKSDKVLKVSVSDLFKAKQNLGNQLSRAFSKLERDVPLTPAEEVGVTIWGSLDDIITKKMPGVKALTKAQSYLYKAAPGIAKNAKATYNMPVVNAKISASPFQTVQDAAGRGLVNTGTALDNVLNKVPSGALQRGAAVSIPSIVNNLGSQGNTPNVPSTYQEPTVPETPSVPEKQTPMNQITPEMLMLGRTMLKDADYNKLVDMYNIQKEANPKDSATIQKRRQALSSADSTIKMVEELALKAPVGIGGSAQAFFGKILPNVEGGPAEDLNRVTDGLAKAIAGALANEVGVATDKDIERWKGLMPKVTDTMEERKRAIARLKEAIAREQAQFGL